MPNNLNSHRLFNIPSSVKSVINMKLEFEKTKSTLEQINSYKKIFNQLQLTQNVLNKSLNPIITIQNTIYNPLNSYNTALEQIIINESVLNQLNVVKKSIEHIQIRSQIDKNFVNAFNAIKTSYPNINSLVSAKISVLNKSPLIDLSDTIQSIQNLYDSLQLDLIENYSTPHDFSFESDNSETIKDETVNDSNFIKYLVFVLLLFLNFYSSEPAKISTKSSEQIILIMDNINSLQSQNYIISKYDLDNLNIESMTNEEFKNYIKSKQNNKISPELKNNIIQLNKSLSENDITFKKIKDDISDTHTAYEAIMYIWNYLVSNNLFDKFKDKFLYVYKRFLDEMKKD